MLTDHLKKEEISQDEHLTLDRTVWRKIDRWVVPLSTGFFLFSTLVRTNIGNARVAGLQKSLAISNDQYTLALTAQYLSHMAAQHPTVLSMKYVGPNIMLPTLVASCGVISASQVVVSSYSGLLTCRLLLGLVAFILALSFICLASILGSSFKNGCIFDTAFTLAGTISGLLATAIEQLHGKGGKPGWAWVLILEGVSTAVFGVISFFLLPRSPETARFLMQDERAYVVSTLKHAGTRSEDDDKDSFSWTEVTGAVKSPHAWVFAVISFFTGTLLFGLAYFEPTIVADLGYAGNQAQLMSVPPFAVTFFMTMILAVVSDHYHCRGYVTVFSSLLAMIGFTMFYASRSKNIHYASLFFSVAGSYCIMPAMNTWVANNSAPHTRRAATILMNSNMLQFGGILTTWLIWSLSPAPRYTKATITFIIMSVCIMVLSSVSLAYFWWQNRLKAERRQMMKKEEEPEGLGDRSAWFVYSL